MLGNLIYASGKLVLGGVEHEQHICRGLAPLTLPPIAPHRVVQPIFFAIFASSPQSMRILLLRLPSEMLHFHPPQDLLSSLHFLDTQRKLKVLSSVIVCKSVAGFISSRIGKSVSLSATRAFTTLLHANTWKAKKNFWMSRNGLLAIILEINIWQD